MVALIGAFLISRVVTLATDKASLNRRLSDVQNEIRLQRSRVEALEEELLAHDRTDFVFDHLPVMVAKRGDVTLRELFDVDTSTTRSEAELAPVFERWVGAVRQAFTELEPRMKAAGERLPRRLTAFATENGIEIPTECRAAYDSVYSSLRNDLRDTRFDESTLSMSATSRAEVDAHVVEWVKRRRDYERDKDLAEFTLQYRKEEEGRITSALKGLINPPGLWWAVGVLCYFALTGVLVPLLLMPAQAALVQEASWGILGKKLNGAAVRLVVTVGFSTGLLAVMMYLVWAVRDLLRDAPADD